MVTADCRTDVPDCRFVIRPDRSMSWHRTVLVYAGMVAMAALIAIACIVAGAWPVVPFLGLEMLGLGLAFYMLACRGNDCEVVSVEGQTVQVEKGRRRPVACWTFPRPWAHVVLRQPGTTWYPSRLTIRSHGREVELGAFLTEIERRRLARALGRIISSGGADWRTPETSSI